MWLIVALDSADDDVDLHEIASQCGYDVPLPGIDDVAEPVVVEWQHQPCLALKLATLLSDSDVQQQLQGLKQRLISHPSVSVEQVLAVVFDDPR